MDIIPLEILDVIAADSEPVYSAMALAIPRFARSLTAGRRFDFMIAFGHNVHVVGGMIEWTRHGRRHSRVFAQCMVDQMVWYCDDAVHRDGAPAVIRHDGSQIWYHRGRYHRDGAPAVMLSDGSELWFNHGDLDHVRMPSPVTAMAWSAIYQNAVAGSIIM